ncbi:MAG: GTPase Era [Gammaproteobacteria bacterium]|nr:GTPase Era [Gammaproteobacteria bacterium]
MSDPSFRSGIVTLIGRPNVGKSTLLNRLVGEKISITSRRPQTTRHRILGIKTTDTAQMVYVDTPGLHAPEGRQLNRYMSKLASGSVEGVDCVVLVIGAEGWRPEDDSALVVAQRLTIPVILAINKIDRMKNQKQLLPLIQTSSERMLFNEIVPLSARNGEGVEELERVLLTYFPEQPPIYPPEQRTDKSERFLASEIVREQIYSNYGQELPYVTTVEVTRFTRVKGKLQVEAVIWAEREGQKAILIGAGGERMKQVGIRARQAMEKRYGVKVNLRLWVRVREGWSDDARAMQRLGYQEDSG